MAGAQVEHPPGPPPLRSRGSAFSTLELSNILNPHCGGGAPVHSCAPAHYQRFPPFPRGTLGARHGLV